MAGFVAINDFDTSPILLAENFQKLLNLTCQLKDLPIPGIQGVGQNCFASKIDAPSSLHYGIVFDESTCSWIMAAGTIVALDGNDDPTILLKELMIDFLNNGARTLERVDGHFGLVIYNGRDQSLSIISDPMGLFAIYYAHIGQRIYISTSAMAVAKHTQSKADLLTIECFLRAGRVHGEKTFWEGVKRVRPATLIKITSEKFEELEYWKPKIDENIAKLSLNEALVIADEKITHVYNKLFSSKEKVWADLTGGFDTRVTVMYLAKLGIPFTAYCVGRFGHPDVKISEEISNIMGWQYAHMSLPENWDQEQIPWLGIASMFGDGQLNIIQLARTLRIQHEDLYIHNVHVSGGGVDEYRYHIFGSKVIIPTNNTQINYEDIINSRILYDIPVSAMKTNRSLEVSNEIKNHLIELQQGYLDWGELARSDLMFMKHRHPIHSGAYLSSQSSIGRTLIPFCLKDLQNYCLSLRHSWRLNYHYAFIRNLIEKTSPDLARIRTVVGGPVEPIRLTNSYKFLPLGKYLMDHFLQKSKKNLLRRMNKANPRKYGSNRSSISRKKKWLEWAVSDDLLNPSKMFSGELYNSTNLSEIISHERLGSINAEEFLQRVLTIEMALRQTNTEA